VDIIFVANTELKTALDQLLFADLAQTVCVA
jgi:hypothetical protein